MLINPKLPKHFFNRDNSLRSAAELKKFWDVPFIEFEEFKPDTYKNYLSRMAKYKHSSTIKIETEVEFDARMAEQKANWLENFPSGIAYRVHCLNDSCWDRPLNWGSFASLEEAKECCETGPEWLKGK